MSDFCQHITSIIRHTAHASARGRLMTVLSRANLRVAAADIRQELSSQFAGSS
jgi:hypothetical protein